MSRYLPAVGQRNNASAPQIAPLRKLNYLNLSQNRIQNQGFTALCHSVLPEMQELAILDLSDGFLTPAAYECMFDLMYANDMYLRPLVHSSIRSYLHRVN